MGKGVTFQSIWRGRLGAKNGQSTYQSMESTGSIRWIHNPVQSRRIWIGLDQKFTSSADSGLDWIQKCAMCIPYLETSCSFSPS